MTKPYKRNVLITNDFSKGSGVIVAKDLVLTCFHMIAVGSDILVDGKPAHIIKVDPKNDLALLGVETIYASPIEFAHVITVDEQIICFGNPASHVDMVLHGRIIDIEFDPPMLYTDAHVFFGSSGGGAYNTKGELVGIVHAVEGEKGLGFPYGVIIPSKTVFDFLVSP